MSEVLATKERALEALRSGLLEDIEDRDDFNFINDGYYDSLDCVEAVMILEEEFDIVITDEQAEDTKTVGEMVILIDKKLALI